MNGTNSPPHPRPLRKMVAAARSRATASTVSTKARVLSDQVIAQPLPKRLTGTVVDCTKRNRILDLNRNELAGRGLRRS